MIFVAVSIDGDLALGLGDQKNHMTSIYQKFFRPNF